MMADKKQPKTGFFREKTIWLALLAGILILIANSALWANNNIYNEEKFSEIVTESITSESSREAIADGVTSEIFKDSPVARRLVGGTSTKLISGLLDTDVFSDIFMF